MNFTYDIKVYKCAWFEEGELEEYDFSTEDYLTEGLEYINAISEQMSSIYSLKVGESMYMQFDRSDENTKGVIIRTE